VEGIRAIDDADFRFAERFSFNIKHLCIGHDRDGRLELRVHPALVPASSVIGNTNDVLNCVFIQGQALGPCVLVGRGAGEMPTAVSVVADIVDVSRSRIEGQGGFSTRGIRLRERELLSMDDVEARYYLRFEVADQPGVLASVAGALGDQNVSIEQMMQEGHGAAGATSVLVLMITHSCTEGAVKRAMAQIAKAPFVKAAPRLIRIEDV
jgi:homoserine dehydrogenase